MAFGIRDTRFHCRNILPKEVSSPVDQNRAYFLASCFQILTFVPFVRSISTGEARTRDGFAEIAALSVLQPTRHDWREAALRCHKRGKLPIGSNIL